MEDLGGGALEKRPAALLLRQGLGAPPPRPDLDPKLYLGVDGESFGLTRLLAAREPLLFRLRVNLASVSPLPILRIVCAAEAP